MSDDEYDYQEVDEEVDEDDVVEMVDADQSVTKRRRKRTVKTTWWTTYVGPEESFMGWRTLWMLTLFAIGAMTLVTFGFSIAWAISGSGWFDDAVFNYKNHFYTTDPANPGFVLQEYTPGPDHTVHISTVIVILMSILALWIVLLLLLIPIILLVRVCSYRMRFRQGLSWTTRWLLNVTGNYETNLGVAMTGFWADMIGYPLLVSYLGENYLQGLFWVAIASAARNGSYILANIASMFEAEETIIKDPMQRLVIGESKTVVGYMMTAVFTLMLNALVLWDFFRYPTSPKPTAAYVITIVWVILEIVQFIIHITLYRIAHHWTLSWFVNWIRSFGVVNRVFNRATAFFGGSFFAETIQYMLLFSRYFVLVYVIRFGNNGSPVEPPQAGF